MQAGRVPGLKLYNILLAAALPKGPAAVEDVLKEMRISGVKLDRYSYHTWLLVYTRASDLDNAERVWDVIVASGTLFLSSLPCGLAMVFEVQLSLKIMEYDTLEWKVDGTPEHQAYAFHRMLFLLV